MFDDIGLFGWIVIGIVLAFIAYKTIGRGRPAARGGGAPVYRGAERPTYDDPTIESRGGFGGTVHTDSTRDDRQIRGTASDLGRPEPLVTPARAARSDEGTSFEEVRRRVSHDDVDNGRFDERHQGAARPAQSTRPAGGKRHDDPDVETRGGFGRS